MKILNVLYCLLLLTPSAFAQDNLQWLRDDSRTDAHVLNYLTHENKITNTFKTALKPQILQLMNEWKTNQPIKSLSLT